MKSLLTHPVTPSLLRNIAGVFLVFFFLPLVAEYSAHGSTVYFVWNIQHILEGFPTFFGFTFVLLAPLAVSVVLLFISFVPLRRPGSLIFWTGTGILVLIFMELFLMLLFYIQAMMPSFPPLGYIFVFLVAASIYGALICFPFLLWMVKEHTKHSKSVHPMVWNGVRLMGIALGFIGIIILGTSIGDTLPGNTMLDWSNPMLSLLLVLMMLPLLLSTPSFFVFPKTHSIWKYYSIYMLGLILAVPILLILITISTGKGPLFFMNGLSNILLIIHIFGGFYGVVFILYRGFIAHWYTKGEIRSLEF